MSSTSPESPTPAPTPAAATHPARLRDPEHYDRVLDAEVDRLVRAMREFRVIRESTLRERMSGELWGAPGFEAALARAVETGVLEELLGFVRLPQSIPADDQTRQDLLQRISRQFPG